MSKSIQSAFGMALSSAFLLWGYEILRSSSMAMIKGAYGSSIVLILLMLSPIVLTCTLLLQSYILRRIGPRKTFLTLGLTAAVSILCCWVGIQYQWKPSFIGLGLLQECYGLLLIEQYWSHINSIMTVPEGKKFNGRIMAISTLGGISGGFCLKFLVQSFGSEMMPLITAGSMIPTLLLANFCFKLCPVTTNKFDSHKEQQKPQWVLFKENRLLLSLLLMVGASQIYSAVVTVHFHTALQDAIPNVDEQTAWGGLFFSSLHIAALFSQLVLSPLLLKSLKPKQILWGIPIVQGFVFFLSQSTNLALPAAASAMMLFKCFDYSIFRTSKETLYIPMNFEERYIAKGWIDVLGYRFGKALGSLGISAFTALGFTHPFIISALGFTSLGLWFKGATNTKCSHNAAESYAATNLEPATSTS
ncbi:MAG: Npt1/Npt2 family nucleotide transporter [Oligoflexales bacterium]